MYVFAKPIYFFPSHEMDTLGLNIKKILRRKLTRFINIFLADTKDFVCIAVRGSVNVNVS